MPNHYLNPLAAANPHRLPDVETFENRNKAALDGIGWYWATGVPGHQWDGDPMGPFETEALALADARGIAFPEEPVHPLDRLAGLAPQQEEPQ